MTLCAENERRLVKRGPEGKKQTGALGDPQSGAGILVLEDQFVQSVVGDDAAQGMTQQNDFVIGVSFGARRNRHRIDSMGNAIDGLFDLFPQVVEGVELVRHHVYGHVANELHYKEPGERAECDEQWPRGATP